MIHNVKETLIFETVQKFWKFQCYEDLQTKIDPKLLVMLVFSQAIFLKNIIGIKKEGIYSVDPIPFKHQTTL